MSADVTEQPATIVYTIICVFVGLFVVIPAIIVLLKKLYLRQKFIKAGFGLRHLGFKSKMPYEQLLEAVKDDKPSHVYKANEWNYLGYNTFDWLYSVVGFDPFGKTEYLNIVYRSKILTPVTIIERYPNSENIYKGHFEITFEGEEDTPLNFLCPVYRLYHAMELPAKAWAWIVVFPYRIRVFESEGQLKDFKLQYSLCDQRSIQGVSSGIYNMWDLYGRTKGTPRSYVYVCGKALDCQKKKNNITGRSFYVTTIDTGIAVLEVPSVRRAYWRLPLKGEYMWVEGNLSGYIERWVEL